MIIWKYHQRLALAKKTASKLKEWGQDENFSNKDMMAAFRLAMPLVLEEDEIRLIQGPKQVPWLYEMVRDELIRMPELSPSPAPPSVDLANDLILDTFTSFEKKLDECLALQRAHTTLITNLLDALEGLEIEVTNLTETIMRRKAKRAEQLNAVSLPPEAESEPLPPPDHPSLRVTVAGFLRGDQKQRIERAIEGFHYNMKLTFDDGHRGPSQIAKFDQIIMLESIGRTWRQTASHKYPHQTHVAKGINQTIELLHKFGNRHPRT
jgi:hypothetical protein